MVTRKPAPKKAPARDTYICQRGNARRERVYTAYCKYTVRLPVSDSKPVGVWRKCTRAGHEPFSRLV
jgi:hypothetical protein